MVNMGLILGIFFCSSSVFAQGLTGSELTSKVTDVTAEYAKSGLLPQFAPTPSPKPNASPSPKSDSTLPDTPVITLNRPRGTETFIFLILNIFPFFTRSVPLSV